MGRIVVSGNVSLDGVMEDPAGDEGSPRGGWFGRASDGDLAAWAAAGLAESLGASALLLGRRSHEWFARRWASREGAWADRLRAMPKHVVSSTPDLTPWGPVSAIGGDLAAAVARLRDAEDGEVLVYGSRTLVGALLGNGLVDEVRLTVFPVVLGGGARLLDGSPEPVGLRLVAAGTLGEGLTTLRYEVGAGASR